MRASQSLMNKLFLLQKRAIRVINNASFNSHIEPLFKRMNILKLQDQYEYEVVVFMSKHLANSFPSSFANTFKYNYHMRENYKTRQSTELMIQRCGSAYLKQFPIYEFPLMWNKWSRIVGTNSSINTMNKKNQI